MAKKRITDYPEATELSNDDYVWIDDGTANGSKKFKAINLGGGSASIERLCYVDYVGNDEQEIPTVRNMEQDTNYGLYLSYSPITKKFTVVQDFDALIVPWVYQYTGAQSTRASGAFYINNTSLVFFKCGTTAEGQTAGKACAASLHAGDTLWSYTPSSDGYPQQRLKIYKVKGITGSDLNVALTYADETT